MNRTIRTFTAMSVAALGLVAAGSAQAGPNAALDALQKTPVSLFTYGLDALGEGVNNYIGRGGKPSPSAMFTAPLSGPIADLSTVIYDDKAATITINLVKIAPLPDDAQPDDTCRQAMTSLRLFAGLDPKTGRLQGGEPSSALAAYFTATGTPTASPANDLPTIDKAFGLRYIFAAGSGHYKCTAPLFGTDQTLSKMSY